MSNVPEIQVREKEQQKINFGDPAYRVYYLTKKDDSYYYKELMILKYEDIVSIDLTHKHEISTDKDVEIKIKNYYVFNAIYKKSLEAPLMIERLFTGFTNDNEINTSNIINFVTAVQQQSSVDDSGVEKDDYIIQGLSLISLLQFKLWYNTKIYSKIPVDDSGNAEKPDDYMYFISNTKDKFQTAVSVTNNVLKSGKVPNGRKSLTNNDTILKACGNITRQGTGNYALPGEYNFECGGVNIAEKFNSVCNDYDYKINMKKRNEFPDGTSAYVIDIIFTRNEPKLLATIDWRYSNQQPISLTTTHDFHSTTSGVYITDDACNDKFYSKIYPYMHTSFDAQSENTDSSDTLDQAKDLIQENLSKIDTMDFEYNELDKDPFTELKLGMYVKYILDIADTKGSGDGDKDKGIIYVITGIQETIEGDNRTINYTLSLADTENVGDIDV